MRYSWTIGVSRTMIMPLLLRSPYFRGRIARTATLATGDPDRWGNREHTSVASLCVSLEIVCLASKGSHGGKRHGVPIPPGFRPVISLKSPRFVRNIYPTTYTVVGCALATNRRFSCQTLVILLSVGTGRTHRRDYTKPGLIPLSSWSRSHKLGLF